MINDGVIVSCDSSSSEGLGRAFGAKEGGVAAVVEATAR
jgi:hypothetical protein